MLARLELNRFPSLIAAVVFSIAAALALGGVLGYTLKPVVHVPGPTHVLVVTQPVDTNPGASDCIWLDGHKAC